MGTTAASAKMPFPVNNRKNTGKFAIGSRVAHRYRALQASPARRPRGSFGQNPVRSLNLSTMRPGEFRWIVRPFYPPLGRSLFVLYHQASLVKIRKQDPEVCRALAPTLSRRLPGAWGACAGEAILRPYAPLPYPDGFHMHPGSPQGEACLALFPHAPCCRRATHASPLPTLTYLARSSDGAPATSESVAPKSNPGYAGCARGGFETTCTGGTRQNETVLVGSGLFPLQTPLTRFLGASA